MTVITPDNYVLSFGQLADVIPPSAAFASLSAPEVKQLGSAWFKLAELHGLMAALNRITPEHRYAGEHQDNGQFVLKRNIGALTIRRTSGMAADGAPSQHFHVYGPRDGEKHLPLLSSEGRMIVGGNWLRDLETAANKLPLTRHEAGATSFQKWLKTQASP